MPISKSIQLWQKNLSNCTAVKSKGKISQNFVAFSEYMNFNPYFFFTDNQHPNKYSTPYHYTEDPVPKNVLDFAYDTALDVGKFEHDTWKDILSKLPSENELRWAYNQSKTEGSGPSMF